MISRIWLGCTTFENADTYENPLKEEIFVGIKNVKSKDSGRFSYSDGDFANLQITFQD